MYLCLCPSIIGGRMDVFHRHKEVCDQLSMMQDPISLQQIVNPA